MIFLVGLFQVQLLPPYILSYFDEIYKGFLKKILFLLKFSNINMLFGGLLFIFTAKNGGASENDSEKVARYRQNALADVASSIAIRGAV